MHIGYLGPPGTFTHFACKKAMAHGDFEAPHMVDYQSLDQLFDALSNGDVTAIFAPIENSIEGPVNRVLDALIHNETTVIDSIISMPIQQSMLSFNSTIAYSDIQDIISMPHAIAQCYSFIRSHCPQAAIHHAPSTAGSVPMIDALGLSKQTAVVIGHAGISDFFPIHVIEQNIHDQKQNMTQFAMITQSSIQQQDQGRTDCMLAFSTPKDAPGSLMNVLDIFKSHHINLTKILSRPKKSAIGSYIFFVEFSLRHLSVSIDALFSTIEAQCLYFKPLGIYGSQHLHD